MTHSKNISSKSSFVRFMAGSILTAFGTARLMRNPRSRMAQGMVVLGAMQAAEGASGYCPTKGMMSNVFQNNKFSNLTQSAGNVAQNMTGGTMQKAANAVQNVVPEVSQLMQDFSNATGGTAAGKSASAGQTGNAGKNASAGQTGTKSTGSQSGSRTKAASSTTNTSGTSFKNGAPSDDMMKDVADKVISAASKNTHAPQITQ